jgi:pimeloyl-ACP methyl ester carboxylesterase
MSPDPGSTSRRDDTPPEIRLLTLSDAVIAIALTLLVLQLHVPTVDQVHNPESAADLAAQLGMGSAQLISYGISFYVILVYVAAFAPDDGESVAQIGDWRVAQAAAAGNSVPDSDGYVWIKQDKFQESFCQDLPADEAIVMALALKAPVGLTALDTISDPAWTKKPTWYQLSTNDRMIHPDSERQMAERMRPRITVELDASHASLASQPAAIADLIDQAATSLT